jgi:SAM-dependent methyltransferase
VGVAGAVRHCLVKSAYGLGQIFSTRRAAADSFDLKYGTDTSLTVSVGDLDIPESKLDHTNRYEAVSPETFLGMLHELNISYEDFTFIDIGSGKGRALLLAAGFPFKAVIGVEISRALTEVARKNIQLFQVARQCRNLHALCEDAATYELPPGNAVVFLYNPFNEHIMRIVLAQIERSLQALSRKVYVIYQMPLHRDLWDRSAYFRLLKENHRVVFYESRTV